MKFIYITLLFFITLSSFSQEILTGLQENPVVKEKVRELSRLKSAQNTDTIPVLLPFHDDFSQGNVFPSSLRWIDRFAYVNNDFPVFPINLGVVTLDAINDSGNFYPEAIPGPSTFIADHLTSRFIRLDSVFAPVPRPLTPADSVYLSFYYQPQGRGLALSGGDSLSLKFLIREAFDTIEGPDTIHKEDQWKFIWSSKGMPLDTFYLAQNTWFRRVMIPITDPTFFKKNFRLQFYNHVSLASNGQPSWQSNADPWNLDEIYLNTGRSRGDTIFPEIRFLEKAPSMLRQYTSMPYRQYSDDPGGEMADTLTIVMNNRDIIPHSCIYRFTVTQPGGAFNQSYQAPEFPMPSYTLTSFGYNERAPVKFAFPISSADSTLFVIKHTIHESTPGSTLGDTIIGFQRFYNYYAYDDGTPENGYGLKGADGRLAYQFKLNVSPDTLRAVRIYFNRTLSSSNHQYFDLTVWNDNNGKPGDIIYSQTEMVTYSDSLNDFHTYYLASPVRISGTFYVGTIQTTDDNLNIGFDAANNAQQHMFFDVSGTWQTSVLGGSLLMHPVIGKPLPVGITEPPAPQEGRISVYPNPCSAGSIRILTVSLPEFSHNSAGWKIIVSSITGVKLFERPYTEIIDVSGLSSGMYLLTLLKPETSERHSSKLIITR